MLKKLLRYVKDEDYRFLIHCDRAKKYTSMPDEAFLKRKFKASMGKALNLENPTTFNEKLQWIKLYDRKPEYTVMADKHLVKDYVSQKLGAQYIIPTLGAWDDPEDIDFDRLPSRFVLKCNHNSGLGMYICQDQSQMDKKAVIKGLKKGLQEDYYLSSREWPYKDIPRKIIAEAYMEDASGGLIDYKVHCFGGEPKFILVCGDRFSGKGLTEDFVTAQWERMEVKRPGIKLSHQLMEKPAQLEEILELSRKLSADIPFVRTDFYIINHKVYFSEITFFPAAGFRPFEPESWDETFGSWIDLPAK